MADDLNDKLRALLNNPEIIGMLSDLTGQKNNDTALDNTDNDTIADIKNMVSKINGNSDKRITLLNALKPYMRSKRADSIDKAIRMLKLTQIGSIFKDI